jgi:fatty-acyl-CoA synthase
LTGKSENLATMRIKVSPLADMLLCGWDHDPGKEALVFPTGRKTYDEVVQSVMRRARGA